MDKRLDDAQSDAEAICASLSTLMMFTLEVDRFAPIWLRLSLADKEVHRATGDRLLAEACAILKLTRESMDRTLQEFRDWFNEKDGCSESMVHLSEPVFKIMEMRRRGVSVANAEYSDFAAKAPSADAG